MAKIDSPVETVMHEPSRIGGNHRPRVCPERGCCPALILAHARASKGGRVRDIAMSWRPSRRLSTRAMWVLWLVCLVLTPGALVLQYVTGRQVNDVSWIRASALLIFLWLMLAWLWPERTHRRRVMALTTGLALV